MKIRDFLFGTKETQPTINLMEMYEAERRSCEVMAELHNKLEKDKRDAYDKRYEEDRIESNRIYQELVEKHGEIHARYLHALMGYGPRLYAPPIMSKMIVY